jgi:hypothetical protein
MPRSPTRDKRRVLCAAIASLAAACAAPAARADIIATVEVPSTSGGDLDIALVNAATGSRISLPAGVNTAANEYHPSITPDGARLVFERSGGVDRIILVDLASGQTADLFDPLVAQQEQPRTPSIASDGLHVYTGRPLLDTASGARPFEAVTGQVDTFDLTPPFTDFAFPVSDATFAARGQTLGPTPDGISNGSRYLAFGVRSGDFDRIAIHDLNDGKTELASEPAAMYAHPVFRSQSGASHPEVVTFERAPALRNGALGTAKIAFRSPSIFAPSITLLPELINAVGADESRPAWSQDGRYLAFIRHPLAGHDRLLVFDTETQTLLNDTGIDLGARPAGAAGDLARRDGNVSLWIKPVLERLRFSGGTFTGSLSTSASVGILVQRIVGRHKLLGRTVPKLRIVGRVPFGHHRAGRFRAHWDRRVNGRRLRPGRYLVTVRALASHKRVRELGHSFTIRIRRG